jgi:hypothetical protein
MTKPALSSSWPSTTIFDIDFVVYLVSMLANLAHSRATRPA